MKNLNVILILIVLTFMNACGANAGGEAESLVDNPTDTRTTREKQKQLNAELEELADEFEEIAASYGVESNPVDSFITGDFEDRTHVRLAGLTRCVYVVDGDGQNNYVEFYRERWEQLTEYQKLKAYFHMQGVCRYDLPSGPTGIMRQNIQGEGEIEQNWDDWVDEFFDTVKNAGF